MIMNCFLFGHDFRPEERMPDFVTLTCVKCGKFIHSKLTNV